jgi:sarcosine oxidase subunit alpha
MLREDGAVLDDGVVSHLEEHHLLLSASTSISQSVYEQLLFYATVAWPELGVRVANLTEQYGGLALAGPLAREVLAELGTDIPLAEPEFPNMSVRLGRVAGLDCMLTRFSFSGELAYEINVGAAHVPLLLQALAALQGKFPLEFYGTEAMNVLRIEKGHCVTGREIDGRVGPHDLGMDRMLKADRLFVGSQALRLPAYSDPDRRHLVGIVAADPLPSGAHLVAHPGTGAQPSLGVVTSHCYSPHAGKYIGLALLSQGRDRLGHSLYASSPVEGKTARVRVVGKDRLLQEP